MVYNGNRTLILDYFCFFLGMCHAHVNVCTEGVINKALRLRNVKSRVSLICCVTN